MLDFGSTEETGSTYIVSDVQAAWYVEQARVSGYMRVLHDVLRQLVSLQYALARADKRQESSGMPRAECETVLGYGKFEFEMLDSRRSRIRPAMISIQARTCMRH